MVKAVFPGSFDPPTYGHLNIISRGAVLFDSLDIVIAVNPEKTRLLSPEVIKSLFEEQLSIMKLVDVRVKIYDGLIVDYCRNVGAAVLLRGVRSLADFNYEFELSILNKQLNEKVETVLIPTEPKYFVLRSSTIKELLKLGGDISAMVPPAVERALLSLDIEEP
jgi:pantetheine-phosphate adenylyltransferase